MLYCCGADCTGCPHLNKECQGDCRQNKGKVYWAKYIGVEVCPIYKCAEGRNLIDCGHCEKIPCEIWFSLKDPSMTDEQHRQSIQERVSRFKKSVK